MFARVKYQNGTLAARYYAYDYWAAMSLTQDSEHFTPTAVASYATRTTTLYSPAQEDWDARTVYMDQFRQRLDETWTVDNYTAYREGQTIFVRFHSEGNRSELGDEVTQLLGLYADLHDNFYTDETTTYQTEPLRIPAVIDIEVRWRDRGVYMWGRMDGDYAHRFNAGEIGLEGYLGGFNNSTTYERGRLRDQP